MEGDEPPPIGLAIRRAAELIGAAINPHLPDKEPDRCICAAHAVFERLAVKKVPTLVLATSSVHGKVKSAMELRKVLSNIR